MIDLSHVIRSGMPVYPGDPEVRLSQALTIVRDGVAVTGVEMGSHTGTHLDAPSHSITGGRTLDQISLDELCGPALVIRVPGVGAAQPLTVDDLGLAERSEVPAIVAVHTGWDQHFGSPQYLRHPYLTRAAAERLRALGMRVLAVDTLNPDRTPDDGEESDFAVHEVVLGGDGLIVENLRGLEQIEDHARLAFIPLRLGAVDGAPVRALAY